MRVTTRKQDKIKTAESEHLNAKNIFLIRWEVLLGDIGVIWTNGRDVGSIHKAYP